MQRGGGLDVFICQTRCVSSHLKVDLYANIGWKPIAQNGLNARGGWHAALIFKIEPGGTLSKDIFSK